MQKPVWGILVVVAVIGGLVLARVFVWDALVGATQEAREHPSTERLKQTAYYRAAAQQISLDQDVLEAVGQPLEFGEVELKSHSGDESHGTVLIDLQVKGPKGAGHGQLQLARQDERHPWVSRGGDFFLAAGGRPIRLLPK